MAKSSAFVEYIVLEIMADIPGIATKRMFSGYGVYKDGIIFALILNDTLYFKTDETNRQRFIDAGSKPFSYTHKNGKEVVTSYWELPSMVLEDKRMLEQWMVDSLRVSHRPT